MTKSSKDLTEIFFNGYMASIANSLKVKNIKDISNDLYKLGVLSEKEYIDVLNELIKMEDTKIKTE